jgi:hypothetical protein
MDVGPAGLVELVGAFEARVWCCSGEGWDRGGDKKGEGGETHVSAPGEGLWDECTVLALAGEAADASGVADFQQMKFGRNWRSVARKGARAGYLHDDDFDDQPHLSGNCTQQIPFGSCTRAGKAWQQVLARDACGRRAVCVCGEVDRRLLQAELRQPPAGAQERQLLSLLRSWPKRRGFALACGASLRAWRPRPIRRPRAMPRLRSFLTKHARERTKLDDLASGWAGQVCAAARLQARAGRDAGEFAREQRKERFRDQGA